MKKIKEILKYFVNRRKNSPLLFPLYGIILLIYLGISTIAGSLMVIVMYNNSLLQLDDFDYGSFLVNLVLWNAIVGSIITLIASHFLLRPINKISNSLNRLASGDYSARLSFSGFFSRNKTFRDLTDSFNTMAEELEQTEMLRSDFVNNFSHEFKTPIVSIAGFAKVLKRGNLSPEEQQEYLSVIESESLRLSQMATNVLNLTKVENQNILANLDTFNLSEQLRTCLLMLENKWSPKNLNLSLPSDEYYIQGNEELLQQVWINLFDNAIKYSPENGTVEADVISDQINVIVTISNYGEPIPEEKIPKIFNKFYQADESHVAEGNGIGLAIVKKVIDLHHGTVSVNCAGGKTSFIVKFPIKEA